jgi:rare lipoprotein A
VEAGSARVEVEAVVPGEVPKAQEAKAVYLQLGAFTAAETAENFRARVYRELTWLAEAILVVPGGNVFRLHLGPYRSPDEARPVADRIEAELKLRPLVVSR